ncbi:hypothetical protein BH23ACT12_BH23ACT12_15930 [soil metagenome]
MNQSASRLPAGLTIAYLMLVLLAVIEAIPSGEADDLSGILLLLVAIPWSFFLPSWVR